MPCRSDYLDPTPNEIKLSKVLDCLTELKTGKPTKSFGTGFGEAYGNAPTELIDKKTEELCSALQKLSDEEISKKSLELQMWWRDHKEADKRRLKAELKKAKDDKERAEALAKLTPHERKLLGH